MGWNVNDLTLQTRAPPAFPGQTGYAVQATQHVIYQSYNVGQGGSGHLWELAWDRGTWSLNDLTSAAAAPTTNQFTNLTSYVFTEDNYSQHVDYMGADSHIYELWRDSDGWHLNDLTAAAGAPTAELGASGFALAGLQQVFYRGTDSHARELWWDAGGWHDRDLTAEAGGPFVEDTPSTYGFTNQLTQHAIYRGPEGFAGASGHIHELWRDANGAWHHNDLTAVTGAPLATDSRPSGYAFEARNTQHVDYRGTEGHIHELLWDANGWHHNDLTAATGAPLANGAPAGFVFVPQGTQHVVYAGTDQHIHELWSDDNGWHHNDLTAATGAPLAFFDPIGYVFPFQENTYSTQSTQHVIYISDDRHIIELFWVPLATNPQLLADLTGSRRADIVGFGAAGVYVALSNGDGTFQAQQLAIADFGYDAGGWRVERHPRLLADLTGNLRADVVGFGGGGVHVALSNGDGTFQPPQLVISDFGYDAGDWRVEKHPRLLADLTGKGRADIVGFHDAGVYVALSNGNGTFQAPRLVIEDFGYVAGDWRVERHPRFLADLTGNGRADIVGFGDAGVYVALGNGDGTFQAPQLVIKDFGYLAGDWHVEKHPRFLADLTGNRRADIVGFGDAGVYVALSNGDGTFQAPQLVIADFGYVAGGWRIEKHPRFLADLTGDGRADIVGFGEIGVHVALSNGNGTFQAPQLPVADFGYEAGGWRVDRNPRFLADVTGNGRADIIGFGDVGVRIALGNGDGNFKATQLGAADFGYEARSW